MKTILYARSFMSYFMAAAMIFSFSAAIGQENAPEKKLRINITTTEDGQTKTVEKEIPLSGQGIAELLEEFGVLDGVDISEEGESVEINIQKRTNGGNDDMTMRMDLDVPNEWVEEMQEQMQERIEEMKEKANRPLLGVYIETADEGARVTKIIPNSGAEAAGLKAGDIILSVDNEPVQNHGQVVGVIQRHEAGDVVPVEFTRDGQKDQVNATLGKRQGLDNDFDFDFDFDDHMEKMGNKYSYHYSNSDSDPDRAFLGITCSSGSEDEPGVMVNSVYEGSSAQKLGLEAGDRITALNGKKVEDLSDLTGELKEMTPGDKVKVQFVRDGNQETVNGPIMSRGETKSADKPYEVKVFKDCKKAGSGNSWNYNYNYNSNSNGTVEKTVNIRIAIEEVTEEEVAQLEENANLTPATELLISEVLFSPNPSRGQFNLSFKLDTRGDTQLEVRDLQGRSVYSREMRNFSGRYSDEINISEEPGGVYFLTITQNGQRFIKKIVKD